MLTRIRSNHNKIPSKILVGVAGLFQFPWWWWWVLRRNIGIEMERYKSFATLWMSKVIKNLINGNVRKLFRDVEKKIYKTNISLIMHSTNAVLIIICCPITETYTCSYIYSCNIYKEVIQQILFVKKMNSNSE